MFCDAIIQFLLFSLSVKSIFGDIDGLCFDVEFEILPFTQTDTSPHIVCYTDIDRLRQTANEPGHSSDENAVMLIACLRLQQGNNQQN